MTTKWVSLSGLLIPCLLILGCSGSKAVKKTDAATQEVQPAQSSEDIGLTAVKKDDLTDKELAQVNKILEELKDIPFDFDSYNIPTAGIEILKKDVGILNDMLAQRGKFIKIVLEGHTDERGSGEYNLALGERRAKTVVSYLKNVGFKNESLRVISYGEEHPKVVGRTVEAWAANRRVHLTVE